MKFIVDTGSPYTFIGKDDAARQTRLLQNLTVREQALMGGGRINIMTIPGPLRIALKQEDGQIFSMELPYFGFSDKTSTKGLSVSPSIIGLDFLRDHGFKLFVDMKNKTAYLEK
ncbi:MAG: hypothetical protein V1887_04100 [Candidatus Aenigmatarchaeota archaeon]